MDAVNPASTAVLASVCADFLGLALKSAEECCAGTRAVAERLADLPATPAVTLRLSDVSPVPPPDSAGAVANAVRCITVDVLGVHVAALPNAAPALSRVLTNGACAREWASRLWRAGASTLRARVISAPEACVHNYTYMLADEESADNSSSRTWTLPLLQTESTPLSAELRGFCGFQLVLELHSSAVQQQPPSCAALEPLLSQLIRSSLLLAPAADLQLEVERASPAPLEASPVAVSAQPPPPQTTVLVSTRSVAGAAGKLERLKQAAAAHLTASNGAASAVQSAGFAQLKTGTDDKRVTWTVTAVVASSSAADETDAVEEERPEAPVREALIFCFADSVLQSHPPIALRDVLRAKATAAECKSAFGLQLRGCGVAAERAALDNSAPAQFSACATMLLAESDPPSVLPALLTLHRTCSMRQPLSLGKQLPKLGRKREAALMKAALFAALREFKTATGGGTHFERGLRTHGFPAIAAAVAKITAAGGEELQARGAALTERGTEAAQPADAVDDEAQARTLEKAVLANLLEMLAGDIPIDLPAPEIEPEAPMGTASADEQQLSTGGREHSALLGEHSRDASQQDDEDVFPQRRRIGSSPPRPSPHEVQQAQPRDDETRSSGDDDGWFM